MTVVAIHSVPAPPPESDGLPVRSSPVCEVVPPRAIRDRVEARRGAGPASRLVITSAVVLAVLGGAASGAHGCERYSAPFFRGSGGFVVAPMDGKAAELRVQSGGASDGRALSAGRDGLAVELLSSPLCFGRNGVFPAQCEVSFSGIKGGGWYWVNGDRNAAVAPLVCSEDLGGGRSPLAPGGVQTLPSRFGTGTLFVHNTQGLMGIVPRLSPAGGGGGASCERYVAPFFRGSGGVVVRPQAGRLAEATFRRNGSTARETLRTGADGLAVQLLSSSLCTDSNGEPVECQVSFTGIGEGGWYWVNGDRNAAVAPLMCEGEATGAPARAPGGVTTSRGAFGTGSLFLHRAQGLMGIVPHLSDLATGERKVEVRVGVFGGGTVEVVGDAGVGAMTCEGTRLCTGFFPAAGAVTLRAMAPFGYVFDDWQGCDSVSSAECTVALHENRQVSVDFKSTQPLTLKDNVVTFDRYRLRDLRQYDPASGVMVLAAGARLDDIEVGSVLVSSVVDRSLDFESFFLRRVTEVRQLAGSPAYLRTTHASVEDLIAEGTVAVRRALGSGAVSSYVLPPELVPIGHAAGDLEVRDLPDGRRVYEVLTRDKPLDAAALPSSATEANGPLQAVATPIRLGVSLEAKGVKVTGTVYLEVEPSFTLDTRSFRVREFKGQATVRSGADLRIVGEVKRDFKYPLLAELALGTIPAGPIVIVPTLEANLVLKLSLQGGFEPVVSLDVEATAGAHYVRDEGWSGIWEFDADPHVADPIGSTVFELNDRATAEIGLAGEVAFKVYGALGPKATVTHGLALSAFTLNPARGSCWWDFEAYKVLEASWGGEFEVFNVGWEWEETLGRSEYPTDFGRNCPEGGIASPAPPANLRFSSAMADSIGIEWDAPRDTGGGYDTAYEVVRSYDPGLGADRVERKYFPVADTRFTDSSLFPDTEYCYEVQTVVAGVARSSLGPKSCKRTLYLDTLPPSVPDGLVATARSSGVVSLRWDAPGDADVSHYVVVEVPDGSDPDEGTRIASAGSASYDVTGLIPNTRYCFGVSAVDEAGNVSAVSGTACASTLRTGDATWRFRIACKGQSYNLEGLVDLDEDFVSVVSFLGEGRDYDGDKLSYALTGPYDSTTRVFDGTIDWTFEGSTGGRRDRFKADLSSNDTGNIPTSKSGSAAGCDAVIRFDRRGAAATSGATAGPMRSGSTWTANRATGERARDRRSSGPPSVGFFRTSTAEKQR